MSQNADLLLHDAKLCLLAAIFCVLFGGIYELFSHDVYSAYMIGAFAIPLFLGALPAGCISRYINTHIKKKNGGGQEEFFPEEPDRTAVAVFSESTEQIEEKPDFSDEETVRAGAAVLPEPAEEKTDFSFEETVRAGAAVLPEAAEEKIDFPGEGKGWAAETVLPGLSEKLNPEDYDIDRYDMIGAQDSLFREKEDNDLRGICIPGRVARNAWYSGLAALTVGCIFRGVLDIYGTTNRLLVVYPLVAAALLGIGFIAFLIPRITLWRMTLRQRE